MADVIKDIRENVPAWQFNVIPGNANQGAILTTTKPLTNPPFKQGDFIWKPMEDIIGTADIKLEYSEEDNIYSLYKAKGHLDNEGSWSYQWELVGQWEPITEEVAEALRSLVYVSYRYDLSIPNTLKVYGTRKDGTEDLMCEINFVSAQVLQQAVDTLNTAIANETTRATNKENEIAGDLTTETNRAVARENELELMIRQATINPGVAIEVVGTDNQVNVKYDNDSIKVNSSNQLKADVFDDTQVRNDKGWSSAKITQQLTSAMTYEGQVATYNDLPTGLGESDKGKTYNVIDTGDNYTWNGTSWDKLSGEYIAGTGIRIQGKVITATGIAFNVGNGLESYPIGESDTGLKTKIGHGLEYDSNFANKVKGGNGIDVNANGVNVTPGDTTQIVSDKVEVKPHNGLVNSTSGLDINTGDGLTIDSSNKVKINTNFNEVSTPLGDASSNLNKHSDGKISVALGEALHGDYLFENATFSPGSWYNLPAGKSISDYTWIQLGRLNAAQFFSLPSTGSEFGFGVAVAGGSSGNIGMLCMGITIDRTNNRVKLNSWGQYGTSNPVQYTAQSSVLDGINIVGIK